MASTYIVHAAGVTHATSATFRCLLQIFKSAAVASTWKIKRIWVMNNQTVAVTGVLPLINIQSISTACTLGTPATQVAVALDTANAAITHDGTTIIINSANTTTGTVVNTYRRLTFSSDEPAVGTYKNENYFSLPQFALIWDAGFGDTNVESLTLPASTAGGIMVSTPGIATGVGNVDVAIEFTSE